MKKITLLFLLYFSSVLAQIEYEYKLCVCAIFKDEAPYMKEWIEYHKLLGVEHFRLYNNDSSDQYLEVLQPYLETGEVTLIDWPSNPDQLGPKQWVWNTQITALFDAIQYFKGKSLWLAIIDLDEYIVPLEHSDLVSFLENYKSDAGVLINWQNFGTSGVWEIPSGNLMIETLTWKAKENSKYNHPVKSIVQPNKVDINKAAWCPHTWSYLSSEDKWILPNRKIWKMGVIDVSKIRINHYVHKTEKNFLEVKIPNKERMEGKKLSGKYIVEWRDSCNKVRDLEIFKFIPLLKEKMNNSEF